MRQRRIQRNVAHHDSLSSTQGQGKTDREKEVSMLQLDDHDDLSQVDEPSSTLPFHIKSPRWLILAIGSGAFAATNGVFAKLTTADKTHTIASSISQAFGFSSTSPALELVLRAIFFGSNLLSNATMWYLFTRALTAGTSTTRVAILNTCANFMITAILGMVVFAEHLPLGWWVGAAMLVAGSVIIGTREGAAQKGTTETNDTSAVAGGEQMPLGSAHRSVLEEIYTDDSDPDSPPPGPLGVQK